MKIEYKKGIKKLWKEYSNAIKDDLKKGFDWRQKIENERLTADEQNTLLEDILKQILIQGRGSKSVTPQVNRLKEEIKPWDIENLIRNLDRIFEPKEGRKNRKREKFNEILYYIKDNSISNWILELHKNNNNIPHMGPKSDDDFLKDHGFYEHVPVDRHTMRFLFRTGILHWYFKNIENKNSKERWDILTLFNLNYENKYKLFRKILEEFCKEFCDEIRPLNSSKNVRFSNNPGIIDLIIWRHCGEDDSLGCKNICGDKPKHDKCVFRETCLLTLLK